MSDTYPVNFTIEIDRPLLRKYLQWRWSRSVVVVVACFFGIFGFAGSVDYIRDHATSQLGAILYMAGAVVISVALSLVASAVIYFGFVRRRVARYVDSLNVSVEGPFLRIREDGLVLIDRKIHFRSIHDYSTVQDSPMRKFGMYSLSFTTSGFRSAHHGANAILGIKDCEKVRDMLAEIDAQRENA